MYFWKQQVFKIIADNSKIVCDEIMYVMGIVSTYMTNTIAANATSNVSINSHNKRVRHKMECFILNTGLLVIILLLIITFICCHYAKNRSKLKKILPY